MARPAHGLATAAVFGLVVMATWTLVIKFLAPVLYVVSEGEPIASAPIMWDFWWVAHLALAWMIWTRHGLAWLTTLAVSAVEVLIVVVKFAMYASAPDTGFWRLLWFTNKVYVLAFFIALLVVAFLPAFRAALRPDPR